MKKNSTRTLEALVQHALIKEKDIPVLKKALAHLPLAISQQMLQLIDQTTNNDPIARQFIPSENELNISPIERDDPIGDNAHQIVSGIVHRYPDRCLFMPVHICPVYCRFCFRKEKIGRSKTTLSQHETNAAINYISNHHEIWEVIITGGDPLILKPIQLQSIIERLNNIQHVEIIRIHTRIPVVEPHRIHTELIHALKCDKPVYVVLHANHPKEFSKDATDACKNLVDAGIPMLSQTTLLKDINDNIEVLSDLMKCFIKNRIKPYYLHHADLVKGTSHFRTSIETGQQLMKQLRGRFSGLCQPTYVLDIPGGYGKVPIGPCYLTKNHDDQYTVLDYCDQNHHYLV